jgi:hypothetical protein
MIRSESSEPREPSLISREGPACRAPRRCSRSRFAPLLAGCLLLSPAVARAADGSPSVPDPAASALFQSGRDLVERGNWDEGCAKFEASMVLYPAASTLLNLARCYEHKGKLAVAWSAYQRALVLNRETQGAERKRGLEEIAMRGLAQVETRLPRIKLDMSNPPAGLRITHNGQDVPLALLGTVLPVDLGPQTITAGAPGFAMFQRTIDAQEGKMSNVTIELAPMMQASMPSGRTVPVWAWIAGGGGIALLAAGAAFRVDQGFVEGRQEGTCGGDVERGCPPLSAYDPSPDNARKNRDFALFAGLGGAGVLALGAAIVGIATAPRGAPEAPQATITPWIGPGIVGAGIEGRF